jgi:iron complex transport system ATP-binding protein
VTKAIELQDVTFAYPSAPAIVRTASLAIERGRVMSILGPNGSGKTTLLKLITGILRPSSGRVEVQGRIGYVPQVLQLSFSYSALDVVLMGRARLIGTFSTPSARDELAAERALDRVGMLAFARRSFDELSGGERQLVAFARALAADADILVLDEPTAALDLHHQQDVLRWIRRLAGEGVTIVMTTHQPQHADIVADDVALIFAADRVVAGPAEEMLTPALLGELFGVSLYRAPNTKRRGALVVEFDDEK